MPVMSTPVSAAWRLGVAAVTLLLLTSVGACGDDDEGGQDAGRDGPGDGGAGALIWHTTCGDPVCRVQDAGAPVDGGPARCGGERQGQPCHNAGAMCDPALGCNVRLVCAAQDPKAGGCPISKLARGDGR